MQKVIGLDIGSYSIKAVEIVNTFKSYEITNFYENVIPEIDGVSPDVLIPACMEQLFTENNLQADRILTAMPGQYISSRIMPFNFADARKIEAAVLSEVEDSVPFDLDQMIMDSQILGTSGGKTIALVVMTRKNFLRNFLGHLQRINIDPKLVDVDSLAFYNLSSYISTEPGKVAAMVDVGHEKTSVCIVQDGLLRMFRSINLGGRYISEFLARDLETSYLDAQRIKHMVGRVICDADKGDDLDQETRVVAERITLAVNLIVKELGRTFYAFKNWEKAPVNHLFLSGGTTRLVNFPKFLEEQLEISASATKLDETALKISSNLHEFMPIMPQSVAIGVRAVTAVKRLSQINLRRGEFAYVQDYESILKTAWMASKVVLYAMLLLLVSYGFKAFFYGRHIEALQSQYKRELAAVFPDAKEKAGARVSFQKFRSDTKLRFTKEIEQKRAAIEGFIRDNSGSGALLALKDISANLPKDVKIDITLYQYNAGADGNGKIILKGETDGYAAVASVVEALKHAPTLKDVEEKNSGAKPGTDNKVIEFTIHANYSGMAGDGGNKA